MLIFYARTKPRAFALKKGPNPFFFFFFFWGGGGGGRWGGGQEIAVFCILFVLLIKKVANFE